MERDTKNFDLSKYPIDTQFVIIGTGTWLTHIVRYNTTLGISESIRRDDTTITSNGHVLTITSTAVTYFSIFVIGNPNGQV